MNMNENNSFTERELLTDLLHTEKELTKNYAGSCTETASPELRQILLRNMTECSNDQYTVFDEMRKRNLYNTKNAPQQELQTAKQSMQDLQDQTW